MLIRRSDVYRPSGAETVRLAPTSRGRRCEANAGRTIAGAPYRFTPAKLHDRPYPNVVALIEALASSIGPVGPKATR
jgi:hypothetical protein